MQDWYKTQNFCLVPFLLMNSRGFGRVKICSQISGFMGVPKDEHFTSLQEFSQRSYSVDECYNLNDHSIEEIWNSKFMRAFRMAKINNVEMGCCRVCRKDETVGGGRDSKRQSVLAKLGEQHRWRVEQAIKNNGALQARPAWWDLRLSNRCNMACRMCLPQSSSKLLVEFRQNREKLTPLDHHNLQITEQEMAKNGWLADSDRFLEDFLDQARDIEVIELHGGEPTIEPGFWKLLSGLIESGHAENIKIVIHTNILKLTSDQIDILDCFQGGKFIASIDSIGRENDFLRYPSKWDDVKKNIPLFAKLGKGWIKNIHQTISAYQCCTVHKFLEFFEQLIVKHNLSLGWSFAFVTNPDWLCISNIPLHLRQAEAHRLQMFYERTPLVEESYFDHQRFRRELQRLINALNTDMPRKERAYQDFLKESAYFDEARSESATDVFPHYRELFLGES
ncbi:MAG: twitch domain-containing radical SAM protein [Bdellovibrionales bacterium]|nr:twitch domain-containing radical SAM protein [Bdellovibrionales bacterium]